MDIINEFLQQELIEHDLRQGTPEWDTFRLEHNGASEAATMLGFLNSRNELLHAKTSGIAREFSVWVQENILDHGHNVEALAKPIIEQRIGRKLYPVVCSRGKLSASCDGRTMSGDIVFEHKQWNTKLVEMVERGELPDTHWPQCQQLLLVTGAEKVIFVVSDGTEKNMVSMEVLPNPDQFRMILAGWAQFNQDCANYQHKEVAELPHPEVSIELPALFITAQGQIIDSNMQAYGKALAGKLAEVRAIKLITDQDFSNAKEAAKLFRDQYKKLELVKAAMLEQTVTIGEAARMIDAWREDLRVTALQLEKDVEREDLAKKRTMVADTAAAYLAYVESHQDNLEADAGSSIAYGIGLTCPTPDFAGALNKKRNYTSMQDALDTTLANGKIAADAVFKDIRAKIVWLREHATDYGFLLNDLQAIIYKPFDDFKLLVETRINNHQQKETQRLALERARIQAEEEAKAKAAQDALLAAELAKMEAEAAAKLTEERARIQAEERAKVAVAAPEIRPVSSVSVLPTLTASGSEKPRQRPTRMQLIEAVAKAYGVSILTADEWLRAAFAMEVAA